MHLPFIFSKNMEKSELARIGNHDRDRSRTLAAADCFHFFHHIIAFHHLSENNVAAVQPSRFHGADKKLRAIGVRAGIGHGKHTGPGVFSGFPFEAFVLEFIAIYGLAARAVVVGEITALAHELRDDAVEPAAFIMQWHARVSHAFFPRAKCPEVFGSLWHGIGEEFKNDAPGRLLVNGDVEKYLGIFRVDFERWSVRFHGRVCVLCVK